MQDTPKIFRLAIQVADVTKAAQFYAALLGMAGRSIRGGRHYFDCGPVILALVAPEGGTAQSNPDDIYFAVTDLEAVHKRADALGCLATSLVHDEPAGAIVVRPWGERSFYAVDPYGNELCFVEAPTIFTGLR